MNITPASHKVKTKFTALFLFLDRKVLSNPHLKIGTHNSIDLITLWAAATTISSDSVSMRSPCFKDNKLKLHKSVKVTCSDLVVKLKLLKIFEINYCSAKDRTSVETVVKLPNSIAQISLQIVYVSLVITRTILINIPSKYFR